MKLINIHFNSFGFNQQKENIDKNKLALSCNNSLISLKFRFKSPLLMLFAHRN